MDYDFYPWIGPLGVLAFGAVVVIVAYWAMGDK